MKRSSRGDLDVSAGTRTPVLTVQSALLWSQIDEQLEIVLSLCRSGFDDASSVHLPPQYDPADYEHGYGVDGLPQYERGDYEPSDTRAKSIHKGSDMALSPTQSLVSVSEKMKMDLEAVTHAIDRLYQAVPQLHNQRVELKKTKLEQMERARREGKSRQLDDSQDTRDLEKMLELVGKAAERKMVNQSVVINADMKARMQRTQAREQVKVSFRLD